MYFFIYLYLDPEARTSNILISLVLPGHLLFFFIICFLNKKNALAQPNLTIWFVLFYLITAFIQVGLLKNTNLS